MSWRDYSEDYNTSSTYYQERTSYREVIPHYEVKKEKRDVFLDSVNSQPACLDLLMQASENNHEKAAKILISNGGSGLARAFLNKMESEYPRRSNDPQLKKYFNRDPVFFLSDFVNYDFDKAIGDRMQALMARYYFLTYVRLKNKHETFLQNAILIWEKISPEHLSDFDNYMIGEYYVVCGKDENQKIKGLNHLYKAAQGDIKDPAVEDARYLLTLHVMPAEESIDTLIGIAQPVPTTQMLLPPPGGPLIFDLDTTQNDSKEVKEQKLLSPVTAEQYKNKIKSLAAEKLDREFKEQKLRDELQTQEWKDTVIHVKEQVLLQMANILPNQIRNINKFLEEKIEKTEANNLRRTVRDQIIIHFQSLTEKISLLQPGARYVEQKNEIAMKIEALSAYLAKQINDKTLKKGNSLFRLGNTFNDKLLPNFLKEIKKLARLCSSLPAESYYRAEKVQSSAVSSMSLFAAPRRQEAQCVQQINNLPAPM